MTPAHRSFKGGMQRQAFVRQKNRCGSCGETITATGEGGTANHLFEERAEGHHVIPHLEGGPITLENCVILCRSCHYNAHQGGQWRNVAIYADVKHLPIHIRIAKIAALYPHYNG